MLHFFHPATPLRFSSRSATPLKTLPTKSKSRKQAFSIPTAHSRKQIPKPTVILLMIGLGSLLTAPDSYAGATVDISGPTTAWSGIGYGSNYGDPSNDQQTGAGEGDVVGNNQHPSVFTQFGDAGTPSLIDGTLAFRIRVGADNSPPGFKTAAFVGIDAIGNVAINAYVDVINSGKVKSIGNWDPDTYS